MQPGQTNSPNRACDEGVLTVLVRGPWMVRQNGHHFAHQLLCARCGLGKGHDAPVHAKRSVAPLSTEKHNGFGTISFRSSSGPPLAQMPPRCLPNVSQMPPRCLPDASQMPLRCLSEIIVWGLALGSYYPHSPIVSHEMSLAES